MTKIIKSYYKFINNFQDDLKGSFLFKMKRRQRTLNLLAWRFILNKVKPIRLDDLLLPRLKRRSVVSWYTIYLRKLRYFYGFYKGYRGVFFKRLHSLIKKYQFNRVSHISSSLELRLDVVLVRLGLFRNVKLSRLYIKKFGVFLNDTRIFNFNYVLRLGDILSFDKNHRIFFKLKLLVKLKPILKLIKFSDDRLSLVLTSFKNNKNLLNLDSSLITFYIRLLFNSIPNFFTKESANLPFRSVFFISYFPRFLESNFSTFEFVCCSEVNPLVDIRYPFKVKSNEVKKLIESTF